MKPKPSHSEFDVADYWGRRHKSLAGIQATGTLGAPQTWQEWLYKGKVRAYLRGFRAVDFQMPGSSALNFGCGNGYFEDIWEAHGAVRTAGIDIVGEVISGLKAKFPHRSYWAGDLAEDPGLVMGIGRYDLVTAIDVLYHIVDDQAVERVVGLLSNCVEKGGCLLFTDALAASQPARHVKFRDLEFWRRLLRSHGFHVVHREPVFILQNRPGRFAAWAPGLSGSLAYLADLPLCRVVPSMANNYAVFCRPVGR